MLKKKNVCVIIGLPSVSFEVKGLWFILFYFIFGFGPSFSLLTIEKRIENIDNKILED